MFWGCCLAIVGGIIASLVVYRDFLKSKYVNLETSDIFRAGIFFSFSSVLLFVVISLFCMRIQLRNLKMDIDSPSGLPFRSDGERQKTLLEKRLERLYNTKKTWYNSKWVKNEIHRTVAKIDHLNGYHEGCESDLSMD